MREIHAWNGFSNGACGPRTKTKGRIQKFKETGDSRYIYQKNLTKLAFNKKWLMELLKTCLEEKLLLINSDVVSENKQLAEELHKPIIGKFEKYKVH